jgi:hypothetical protein
MSVARFYCACLLNEGVTDTKCIGDALVHAVLLPARADRWS